MFFDCGFSKRVWGEVMQKCLQIDIPTGWEEILSKGIKEWRSKSLQAVVCKLAWGASIYNIWRQRNDVKHENQIRSRIVGKGKFKATDENVAVCSSSVSLKMLCLDGYWCLLI